MSSGIKHCAFGRQCFIAELHVRERTRRDWTEIQECDKKMKLSTFMQKLTSKAVAPELVPEDLRRVVGNAVVFARYVVRDAFVRAAILLSFSYVPLYLFLVLAARPTRCGGSGLLVHQRCSVTFFTRVQAGAVDAAGAAADVAGAAGGAAGAAGAAAGGAVGATGGAAGAAAAAGPAEGDTALRAVIRRYLDVPAKGASPDISRKAAAAKRKAAIVRKKSLLKTAGVNPMQLTCFLN